MKVIALGKYGGFLRALAHGVKDGDEDCLYFAAKAYADILPRKSAVVPVPSHTGRATTMLKIARIIRSIRPDISVFDCLECEPHLSSHFQKKMGWEPAPIKMRLRCRAPSVKRHTYILDNCACTYATAGAAASLLKSADLMVLAVAEWRKR